MQNAVAAARGDLLPLLRVLTRIGPLPEAFWQDRYVLGYLSAVAGMAAEEATEGRLGEKDLAKVSFRALGSIAGKPAVALRAAVENGAADALAEFADGFEAASMVAAVHSGSDEFDRDRAVIGARKFVAENSDRLDSDGAPADMAARVALILESTLFYTYAIETYLSETARKLAVQSAMIAP